MCIDFLSLYTQVVWQGISRYFINNKNSNTQWRILEIIIIKVTTSKTKNRTCLPNDIHACKTKKKHRSLSEI